MHHGSVIQTMMADSNVWNTGVMAMVVMVVAAMVEIIHARNKMEPGGHAVLVVLLMLLDLTEKAVTVGSPIHNAVTAVDDLYQMMLLHALRSDHRLL
jgi:hypothetical protein